MKGNNDILCLTRPDLVAELHAMYFEAGADISETNTFSATVIAQDDYKLDAKAVRDINYEGARIGREGGRPLQREGAEQAALPRRLDRAAEQDAVDVLGRERSGRAAGGLR